MTNEEYPLDRTGGVWDRVWRGRRSSVRRNLDNAALEAWRFATLVGEIGREADAAPGDRRSAALHAIRDEILGLRDDMLVTADFVLAEAGPRPRRAGLLVRVWRALRRDFLRWLHG